MILTGEPEAQLLSAVRGSIILLTTAEMYHGEKQLTSHTYLEGSWPAYSVSDVFPCQEPLYLQVILYVSALPK